MGSPPLINRTFLAPRVPGTNGLWKDGDQTACKPGSVPPPLTRKRDGHSSGPPVAGRFSRPTRASGPAKPCRPCGRRDTPIRSCSRRGLPCRPGHPVRGGLLPHPFTLTLRPKPSGGLLSVALSLGSPPAGVTRRLIAVEPGLSSPPPLPTRERPPGRLIRFHRGRTGGGGQARRARRHGRGIKPPAAGAPSAAPGFRRRRHRLHDQDASDAGRP